jgi:glutathione S-transferase
MAIVSYLEEIYPDPPLYPSGARRAEADVFIDWFNRVWKVPPNEIESELLKARPDRARVEALAAEMGRALDLFERMIQGRAYLMGDEFSAADCAAFPFLKYARRRDPTDDELFHRVLDDYQQLGDDHRRLAGWIDRVDQRPRA